MIREPDVDNARTSLNQSMWNNTKNVGPSNFDKVSITKQRDSIQVLHHTKVYHFDDANTCFVKNPEDDFIGCLKKLPIIFNHIVFNLRKTSPEKLEAQVQHLHEQQKTVRAQYDATWKAIMSTKTKQKADA